MACDKDTAVRMDARQSKIGTRRTISVTDIPILFIPSCPYEVVCAAPSIDRVPQAFAYFSEFGRLGLFLMRVDLGTAIRSKK